MMNNETVFSAKQRTVLGFGVAAKYASYDALICDGAVRSGKTYAMSLSFLGWAFMRFSGETFAFCGKTLLSIHRNVLEPLFKILRAHRLSVHDNRSAHWFDLTLCDSSHVPHTNRFYYFGGYDESSAALIQGLTLAGIFFDEVALMPRSFVEQGLARCSVSGARFWFNCNPASPSHWFYREWILHADEKHALCLHFTMRDNPALSPEVLSRYESLYSGVFYRRYILGEWTAADGQIYPMFSRTRHVVDDPPECYEYYLSCDYGTHNPTSVGLWGKSGEVWYRLREYYYSGGITGVTRTDEEHYAALEDLAGDLPIRAIIIDPSAASFIATIRRHARFRVLPAKNDVLPGIQDVCRALQDDRIRIHSGCRGFLREVESYEWGNADVPRKVDDHAMDDTRYFVHSVIYSRPSGFFVGNIARSVL